MKPSLLAALLALLPVLGAAAPVAPKIAFVMDGVEPSNKAVFERLTGAYRTRASISVFRVEDLRLLNPIAKGRLLSDLESRELVVAVGDGATDFVVRELEDVPIYFVDAAVVSGGALKSETLGGIFSYSVDRLLEGAGNLRLSPVGVVFTPGYEPVLDWIRASAAARGIALVEKAVPEPVDLAGAIDGLMARSRSLMVVGDPLLVRGAGFELIREKTLSGGVPVIAPGEWDVRHGALVGYAADVDGETVAAEFAIDRILRSGAGGERRLSPAPAGGTVLFNATLAKKWNLDPPRGARWRQLQ